MTRVEDPGTARYIRNMSKEMAHQSEGEAGEKEACGNQIKESDKDEVGGIVGRVSGCFGE